MRGQDTGRVLFKESYNTDLLQIVAIPFVFLISGFFMLAWDPELGAWSLLIGALSAIVEYLLLPQRLLVATAGFRPQLMRYKAIKNGAHLVPWGSVTAVWPLYFSNPLMGTSVLRGFEVAAPILGTSKLVPAKSFSRKTKLERLEGALKEGLGTRFDSVWREIPEISKADVERMRKVLMTSSKKEAVAGIGKIYVSSFAVVELSIGYVMIGETVHSVDQLCLLVTLFIVAAAVLFGITIVVMYLFIKRQSLFFETLSLYFQVRRYEESSGKHLLPQMQMLAMYRRLDPKPPPTETWKGPELLKAFRRASVKAYCWFGASFAIPLAAMAVVFNYGVSPWVIPLVVAFMPAAMLLGASSLFESLALTIEMKTIVHEEWKTGKRFLPESASLKLWGIERDPAKLMQKNLPKLRKVAAKGKRRQSMYVDPAVLRTILEYEEVTGRQLLPPELASLREK